ncbi:reprolysin-like metallopeptidase [Aquimarina hainanensis]|uniref:Reprolysin-like metallopeptidase n=1 Tax=Aquimarina hainanensis TaxID=1578017 RepID=A0ABW5NC70_9FLAO
MKTHFLWLACLFFIGISYSQTNNYWTPATISKSNIVQPSKKELSNNTILGLNLEGIKKALQKAPLKSKTTASSLTIQFPDKNGELKTYRIFERTVLHPELAKEFPDIKSYTGINVNDKATLIHFSIASDGFHGMITSPNKIATYIDPYTKNNASYVLYSKSDLSARSNFACAVEDQVSTKQVSNPLLKNANDGKLRTYRLAIACTGEYSQFHLNNQGVPSSASDATKKAAVLSAMNTTMTRVNGIYERDLGVTMQLVPNNTKIIYLNASTDGLSNNNAGALIGESQRVCDREIGSSNYDIGHTFSTGGGGLAGLGVVCRNGSKGRGITGSSNPISDPYDIDYVAHEIGHQFGANHTFNNACGGNRNSSTAMEPGSGNTIMSYAGICSPNVRNNSDDHFHAISIQEMWNHVSSTSCAVSSNTGNNAPTANAGANYTIPKSTPFILKGSATDADGDALTYNWEQMDNQIATMPPNSSSSSGPAFRSYPSSSSPDRYMPKLSTVIGGSTSSTWEVVPSVARTMKFRLTVRDNHAGGGNSASDNMTVSVSGNAGPFVINSPNTNVSWSANSSQTVTWNVAGTTANGINAANVDILLSTDGGNTYPITLASNVTNDGSHTITVPNNQGSQNRIMVRGSNHIFYDISNANFTITGGGSGDTQAPSTPTALAASNATQTTIDLNWTASTDNVGVTGYDVYAGNTMIGTATATSYTATGLTPDTSYTFKVKAKDAAGNMSQFSNTATLSTLPGTGGDGCTNGISSFPYKQGFENTIGNWIQSTNDNLNWTVDANGTPSRNTGPSNAAQGTYYLYIEASGSGFPRKRAIITSPCLDLTNINQASFAFKYHMYGASSMGSLHLEISKDGGTTWTSIWNKSGNQGNSWKSATIDLGSYIGSGVQLRFNGLTGNTWQSDIAIDDVVLSSNTTDPTCTDVNLTIKLDNYPRETSWEIKDTNNQTVASGGPYTSEPRGATVTATKCLAAGSYTFTIKDTYGDGICCSYGNGNYKLTAGTTTLASGGQFAGSESTTFTIGNFAKGVEVDSFETTTQNSLELFPNPIKGNEMLTVIHSGKKASFILRDIVGRTIKKGTINNNTISFKEVNSGAYLLSLIIDEKHSTHRVIKK